MLAMKSRPAINSLTRALLAVAAIVSINFDRTFIVPCPCSAYSQENVKEFQSLADEFMKESLARSPSTASQVGYHKHTDRNGKVIELDGLLDDMSLGFMKDQESFYKKWREDFKQFATAGGAARKALDPESAADWQLIDDQIALNLLELQDIQNYKHNPTMVVEMIGSAVFQPLTTDYAEKDVRVSHVLSRIRAVPRVLAQVKEYLNDADPIYIKTAVEENEGNVDLIENTVLKEIPAGSPLKAEYDKVAPPAVAALKDFNQWLDHHLAGGKQERSWRLGKKLYDEKFKLVMETNTTPERLLSEAEHDLKSVRAEMLELAMPLYKKLYPDQGEHSNLSQSEREDLIISAVLKDISKNHPKRDQLQQAIENDLEGIKKFIREKKIVSLSTRDNLKVIPTPPFMRGIYSVAGFHSAPPLEPQAEAEYWVTPIDPKLPEAKAESKLQEYNNYTLKWLTIHEALPGHYIQFEHLNNIEPKQRRLLRSLYSNGAYVEGWAEYIAQVMLDEGFMSDDPRFRLIMRKIRLRLLANTILDVRMHTMEMSDQEAMNLMTKRTFQTQAEAEGKLKRAKLSSTQLPTYYAGLKEWLAFRKKYQEERGAHFNLLAFHNLVLDEGPLPVPIVANLIEIKEKEKEAKSASH